MRNMRNVFRISIFQIYYSKVTSQMAVLLKSKFSKFYTERFDGFTFLDIRGCGVPDFSPLMSGFQILQLFTLCLTCKLPLCLVLWLWISLFTVKILSNISGSVSV